MNFPSTHRTLLDRVRSGDEVSWEEFYGRYSPVIRFSGGLYGLREDECRNLVQRVMVKFFNSAGRFVYREGEVRFRTYFSTVIRSAAGYPVIRFGRRRGDGVWAVSGFRRPIRRSRSIFQVPLRSGRRGC